MLRRRSTGIAGATFAIYKDQSEGAPLWLETQNVQPDAKGNYTVQLGATKPDGLPLDLFTSGEGRWLGVTINGGSEQPRVLLLSVPYALKAADAETVGGLPASAFVLANKAPENVAAAPTASNTSKSTAPPPANPTVTGKGAAGFVPMWDSASDIVDSVVSQKNSLVGINTGTPAATLDVNGKGDVRDTLTLFPKGTDPTLAINGTTFKVDQTGKVTFVTGQAFPHTISGVKAGTDLTGGGTGGTVTLNLDTTKVPQLNLANAFVGNQGVVGNVTVSGTVGIGTTTPSQALDLGTNNSMVIRVNPGNDTTEANGGYSLVGRGAGGVPNTWWTLTAPVGGGFGVPANSYSIWQYPPNGVPGCCLNRFNILAAEASTDTGGTVTIDQNGNADQTRTAGGWVKGMVYVNSLTPPYQILKCFNSTLAGAAATTPPCGIDFTEDGLGAGFWDFYFGFEVNDRFFSATIAQYANGVDAMCITAYPISANTVQVNTADCSGNPKGASFYLIVY